MIAGWTAAQRDERSEKIQTFQNLEELKPGLFPACTPDTRGRAMPSNPCPPQEQYPAFGLGQPHQFIRPGILCSAGVEAAQPQISDQSVKTGAGKKFRFPQGYRAQARHGSDVEEFENRIETEPFAVPETVREIHRRPVRKNEIHLFGRNVERTQQFQDGKIAFEGMLELDLSLPGRKVVVQLFVKSQVDFSAHARAGRPCPISLLIPKGLCTPHGDRIYSQFFHLPRRAESE